jgi:hypothetical protein
LEVILHQNNIEIVVAISTTECTPVLPSIPLLAFPFEITALEGIFLLILQIAPPTIRISCSLTLSPNWKYRR